jgi:hypothetical protein
MSVYKKILRLLLEESQKINLPDEAMLKKGLVITNKEGFKYTIKDVKVDIEGKRKFLIVSKDYEDLFDYKTLKNKFERA